MSQPPAPPNSPDNPASPDTPADPDREAARTELRGLVKEAVLEVITEREQAPPKGKKKVDVLQMLFGPSGD